MIKHVVCFKLADSNAHNCAQAKQVLESMKGKVPTAKEISVHIDELKSPRSFDIMLEVLVDNWEALEEYQNDLYHCNIVKKHMRAVSQQSISLDFEL